MHWKRTSSYPKTFGCFIAGEARLCEKITWDLCSIQVENICCYFIWAHQGNRWWNQRIIETWLCVCIERIYYYLEDKKQEDQGIIVFDDLEKSKSHILVGQLENYFKKTVKGRQRSSLVIPEPFFVHSDLTTGIQIADLIAYIISWGLRLKGMDKPVRAEMKEFVELIKPLRYLTTRELGDVHNMQIWSVIYVK